MWILTAFFFLVLSLVNAFQSLSGNQKININTQSNKENGNILKSNEICVNDNLLAISRNKRLRLKDVRAYDALSDAFVGGTVGVMSVAFILELRKVGDQSLDGCPYCMGNGEILCGSCFGSPSGILVNGKACNCNVCVGRGLVQCINCKGDGRITPILLQSKAIRDPDYSNIRLQERNKK
jgi:hypothetical protein